jgi:hypothetical protein
MKISSSYARRNFQNEGAASPRTGHGAKFTAE